MPYTILRNKNICGPPISNRYEPPLVKAASCLKQTTAIDRLVRAWFSTQFGPSLNVASYPTNILKCCFDVVITLKGRDYFTGNFYLLFYFFWPKSNPNSNSYSESDPNPNPKRNLTLKKVNDKRVDEYFFFRFISLNLKIFGKVSYS